jgi:hypothetical protein
MISLRCLSRTLCFLRIVAIMPGAIFKFILHGSVGYLHIIDFFLRVKGRDHGTTLESQC